jgi:hypothetical protein
MFIQWHEYSHNKSKLIKILSSKIKKSFLQHGFDSIKNQNYESKKFKDFKKKLKKLFYNYMHRHQRLAVCIWKQQ